VCINEWVREHPTCPICRGPVNSHRELIQAVKSGNQKECIKLCNEGVDVEAADKIGYNALHYAVYFNRYINVNFLLNNGTKVDALDKNGWSSLMTAAWMGYIELVKKLLQFGADTNLKNPYGYTAYELGNNHVKKIFQEFEKEKQRRIHAEIEAQRQHAKKLNKQFLEAAEEGDLVKVHDLIAEGADVDSCMENGLTAIHIATMKGNESLVMALLKYNPNLNRPSSKWKITPLMYAAAGNRANLKVVKVLLERDANKYLKNNGGNTVFDLTKDLDIKALLKLPKALRLKSNTEEIHLGDGRNVLLYREKFQGKAIRKQKPYQISRRIVYATHAAALTLKKLQKPYQISRNIVKIKRFQDSCATPIIVYATHAEALGLKKLQKPYRVTLKTKNESEMHSRIEYVIHAAALAEKKMRIYRINRVLCPVNYELSNLEYSLANLGQMQPAQMRVHLKELTRTDVNRNWNKTRLQTKLQQLWNARCDLLRANLSNKKSELNNADGYREKFTSFLEMVSRPAQEIRINKDGQIESTMYWKNVPIRCIHENENTIERFVYNNKEFTIEKTFGTAVQYLYAPTKGQENETIEIGYQIPYECYEVMKRKVQMKVFIKGRAQYAIEISWKEGKLKVKKIPFEDLKITKMTTRKQLQKTYLEQLLK
jgi:ankyrin repeat protein